MHHCLRFGCVPQGQIMSRFLSLVFILVGLNIAECDSYAQRANATPEEQQAHRENLPKNRSATPDSKPVIRQGKTSDPNSADDKQDGAADPEERIARFTEYGFWIALGQFIAAGVGIYYVIKTLRVTQQQTAEIIKQTNEFARQGADFAAQTKLMRDNHTSEQRPWLAVDFEIEQGDAFEGTTIDGDPGYYIRVKCTAKNTGQSPALSVLHFADLIIPSADELRKADFFANALKEAGEFYGAVAPKIVGQAIFPGGERTFEERVITKASKIVHNDTCDPEEFGSFVTIFICGVVRYKSFEEPEIRQTRYMYAIGGIASDGSAIEYGIGVPVFLKTRIAIRHRTCRIEAD